MRKLIESLTGGYSSSAKVVDGTLILSLPDALSPIVWRMDLGQAKSSALEVREGKDQTFVLTLKTPREDVHTIAPFATRAQAVRALMAVTAALEQPQGQIIRSGAANDSSVSTPAQNASRKKGGWKKWIFVLAGMIVVLFAINMLAHTPLPTESLTGIAQETGVPLSADDFLKSR